MTLPFALGIAGVTTGPVCSILLLVFSALTWPPWGDSLIDGDLRRARGTVLALASVEQSQHGVSSYHVMTRIDTGPDKGKRARVFCSRRTSKCPAMNEAFDFEYCAHDRDIGRMPGGRATVFAPAITILLAAGGVLGLTLLGAAAVTFLRVQARRKTP